MQAIDRRSGNVATDIYTRVMAAFGTLVAVVLIALAIIYGGVLIQGALAAKTTTTSISAPVNLAFRAGERAALVDTQSSTALQNQFRAGERAALVDTQSSASLRNQFRAGERGDSVSH